MRLRLFLYGITFWVGLFFTVVFPLSADEWKPRHDLVSHTGVMNLNEPPPPGEVFFFGPDSPLDQPAWLEGLKAWRSNRRTLLRYNGAEYDRPELDWTRQLFSQVQLLIWDRSLYDPEKREYTVDQFMTETEKRIGPIDSVLIWHVYPNLGVDDRNQLDLLRDLPGGIHGLRQLVEQFHNHGVKVFFPFLVWDTGTRPVGADPAIAMVQLMKDIGADGINFDTLESVPLHFRDASDKLGHPLALEPQFQPRDESIAWTTLSWNDWVTWEGKPYPFVPMVSKDKWMETRHTVNVTDRFTRDKTDSLQHAFFNGQGYATLENLWGLWYGDTPHDAEAVLRCTRIERAMADYLRSPEWEPHAPMIQSGVFAGRFPGKNGTLWTIVNRNESDVNGPQLANRNQPGMHYYDLWHGAELQPSTENGMSVLNFDLESLGFGAILATSDASEQARTRELMEFMSERSRRPLSTYSREWTAVPQTIVDILPTKPASSAPSGMIRIPEADFDFDVKGIEIEGGNDPGVDVQYPWENEPRRTHDHRLHLHSFFMDRTPVTNAEFAKFLDNTRYHPVDDHNFLRDWQDGGYPKGWENKPVTWVSIEDASAYCESNGKRLPHEWEWQYAAQSTDGRAYPWGSNWREDALPPVDHGPVMRPPADVTAFPSGASPFGVLDLVGNVSQWTDEYRDPHTRAAIIRGGAAYEPTGSLWYFPQTYRLDEHEKYLLMSPGRDRAGTIGFRCVVDAP
ncbi:MAG TPA: SUMF1/EgtB/PvdO family nonheme iron enzyme [Verrucomicrobiae bacterium]|nr:SUMF1/EgtB/PvdO family nonheme iron enzyme [Verrucomicrobiae bacterium]